MALASVGFAQKPELRLFIWSEYIDPAIPKQFEAQTGIRVRIDLYESNEDMLAKLQAGGVSQYDLIVPSDFIVPTLVNLKLVQPIDKSRIPNFKNLDPKFVNPPFDPGNRYSVAYQWGFVGLMYRKDRFRTPPTSWAVLLDPQQQVGPFTLLDSVREMLGIALRYRGGSVNAKDPARVKAAGDLLLAAKKSRQSLGFDGGVGGKNKVMAGQAAAAVVYNGDAVRAMSESPNVAFVLPKEGATLAVDSLMIPAKAPNVAAAYRFINYILDPKVGAQLSNFNRFATPNKASLPFITPADRANPAIYPDAAGMGRLEYILDLGRDTRLYDEIWTQVKSR